jgi:DNA polymerase type B, organellar and viral
MKIAQSFSGLDGEGCGGKIVDDPHHKYILLAASTEGNKQRWWVEKPSGLSTEECLYFLINLPKKLRLFSYFFNYDLTKLLQDVDNQRLYFLFRPETRPNRAKHSRGPMPVSYNGYSLSMQGTKFTIERGTKRTEIWDLGKFFQAKFVAALQEWKIGDAEMWDRMSVMKNKRGTFTLEEFEEIKTYCFSETAAMATLAHKLLDAHDAVGLKLTSFYGAGSSASAMLKLMHIKEQLRPVPDDMIVAVSQAFFGGRFENSVIGAVKDPCYNFDLASAYPYTITFLPCLMHGTWRHVRHRSDIDSCRVSLVKYGLNKKVQVQDWAPFPFREKDGSISFPAHSPGGWVWSDEYLAGERAFPELVQFKEAWVLDSSCDCQPFSDVPKYYRQRCLIGKESKGLTLKLACNSLYGKLAQSIGSAVFNNWIWAGIITAGCRAKILDLFNLYSDRSDILMIATDGLLAKHGIIPPVPRDTGTFDCVKPDGSQAPALGSWEESVMERGCFLARAGIYFPINPNAKDLKKVKGRGVGKSVILHNHKLITDVWERDGLEGKVNVSGVERFCGGKTSISYSPAEGKFTRASGGFDMSLDPPKRVEPAYGEWIERVVSLGFNPMPKRSGVIEGSYAPGEAKRLWLREIEGSETSQVYKKAVQSEEAQAMMAIQLELEEQPDGDWSEMDDD